MKRPLGVSLISYFYIFGVVVLIVTAMFFDADANKFGMADRFAYRTFQNNYLGLFWQLFPLSSYMVICD